MRTLLAAVVALLLAFLPATAQTLDGRALIVTDGRTDKAHTDKAGPAPLLIVLHGLTGTGKIMQRKTGFDALAAAHGFVVAYPNGTARRWRYGLDSADTAYIANLITTLTSDYSTDPARVFVVGYSNGGAMALRLSCALPDRIHAIAMVGMTQPRDVTCPTAEPLPALFIHGALDPIVPIEGRPANKRTDELFSLERSLALWATRNRCAGTTSTQTFDQGAGPDAARITRYTACRAPLTAAVLTGQGHDWPGAAPTLSLLLGPASLEMDAAPFIWQFFARQ